jgi:DNA-directed RNA polymerase subunit beta
MAKSFTGRKRIRKSFGRIPEVARMPNLIEVQKSSYDHFLQIGVSADKRQNVGLRKCSIGLSRSATFRIARTAVRQIRAEEPKYDVEECQQRGMTFAAPLKVTLRLVVWDVDEDTGSRSIRDIKEQDVYMGDMPLMTANGTFIVNGTERVIVSQMHRSPGVFFDHDKGKTHSSGKYLFCRPRHPLSRLVARISNSTPRTWSMSVSTGAGNCRLPRCCLPCGTGRVQEKIDKGGEATEQERRFGGMSNEEILNTFYDTVTFSRSKKGWQTAFDPERMRGIKLTADLKSASNSKGDGRGGHQNDPASGPPSA